MPDVYASIAEASVETQQRLADIIESRFADPRQQAMVHAYLADIALPDHAEVLEVGCGTGAVSRTLAAWPGVARVVGVDPAPVFVGRARSLAAAVSNVSFVEGDGRALAFDAARFDLVVLHTTMCHVPGPERLVAEARRVLRSDGQIAVFDGDYATATVATGPFDPLQACVDAFRLAYVHDAWLVRRLPALLDAGGFDAAPMRSHGYVEAPEAGYLATWIDRGADALAASHCIGEDQARAMRAEARERSADRRWFGHVAYASVVARRRVGA
jgi:ubiquinone/menaquinone biosynthesis C-methylase UbiE